MRDDGFVIFDLDGTLFDTRGDIARAVNAGLAAHGLPAAEESLIVSFVGDGVGRLVDRTVEAVGGDLALAPRIAEELIAFYGRHPVDRTHPYAGIVEALQSVGQVPLAVASNKPTALCRMIISHFAWDPYFQQILGSDWGGPRKPDPAVLLELANRLGREPGAGVMVGDSLMDLQSGRAAGMRTVAACYGFRPEAELRAAGADYYASRATDLGATLASALTAAPG